MPPANQNLLLIRLGISPHASRVRAAVLAAITFLGSLHRVLFAHCAHAPVLTLHVAGRPDWAAAAETPSTIEPASLVLATGASSPSASFTVSNVVGRTAITYALSHVAALSYRLSGDGVRLTRDFVEGSLRRAELPPVAAAATARFYVDGHFATYVTVPAGASISVKVRLQGLAWKLMNAHVAIHRGSLKVLRHT